SAKARVNASSKCSGLIAANGGTPNGPLQSWSSGFSVRKEEPEAWFWVMRWDMGFWTLRCHRGQQSGPKYVRARSYRISRIGARYSRGIAGEARTSMTDFHG